MTKAKIILINKIDKYNCVILYEFFKVTKYKDLYRDLPILLQKNGYPKKKYAECQMHFEFYYLNTEHTIEDWDNYILNNDVITVTISNPKSYFYLIDSFNNSIIFKSENIRDLYTYYNNIINKIDNPLFIRNNFRLIDVLDNPKRYLNSCINRLIHKRNY